MNHGTAWSSLESGRQKSTRECGSGGRSVAQPPDVMLRPRVRARDCLSPDRLTWRARDQVI